MKLKLNIKIALLLIAAGLLGACSSAPPPQQAELPTAPSTQNAVEVTAPATPTPSPTVASTEATGPTPANQALANPTPVNNDTSNSGGSVQDVAPTTSASAGAGGRWPPVGAGADFCRHSRASPHALR
ncbi:MAG: hypothetical protein HYR94_01765 [Chloroflexi bacterium]|nr:hypothetical protein [Chloroflexota bacterium]